MIEKTILAEENRFEAVLTEGLPRLEAEIAKVIATPDRRCCSGDAAFRLYDTFGVPYDFIEDTAATQGVTRRSRPRSTWRWKRSATRRARAARSAAAEGRGLHAGRGRIGRSAQRRRRSVRGLRDDPRHGCAGRRAVRRAAPAGGGARHGSDRLRGAGEDAVLPRGRRPGVRFRTHRQRGDERLGDRRRARAHPDRVCRARTACG